MLSPDHPRTSIKLTLLVMPDFSLLSLCSFTDRFAAFRHEFAGNNDVSVSWTLITSDGKPVNSSCGVTIASNGSADNHRISSETCNYFVIFGGKDIYQTSDIPSGIKPLLIDVISKDITVVSVDRAAFLLAELRLIRDNIFISHSQKADFLEALPSLQASFSDDLVIADNFWYCPGRNASAAASELIIKKKNNILEFISLHLSQTLSENAGISCSQIQDINFHPELSKALRFIITNIAHGPDTREMLQFCGVSKKMLDRLIFRETGRTLLQIISDLRVEVAYILMKDKKKSLSEIAGGCGFSSATDFSRFFKNRTGITPGLWQYEYFIKVNGQAK